MIKSFTEKNRDMSELFAVGINEIDTRTCDSTLLKMYGELYGLLNQLIEIENDFDTVVIHDAHKKYASKAKRSQNLTISIIDKIYDIYQVGEKIPTSSIDSVIFAGVKKNYVTIANLTDLETIHPYVILSLFKIIMRDYDLSFSSINLSREHIMKLYLFKQLEGSIQNGFNIQTKENMMKLPPKFRNVHWENLFQKN